MENNTKKTTTTVVIVIILLIVAFGIFVFVKNKEATSTNSLTVEQTTLLAKDARTVEVGKRLLNLLRPFSTLDVDNNFFDDARFKSLVDFSIEIPSQSTRDTTDNPFAPLPGSRKAATASAEGGVNLGR